MKKTKKKPSSARSASSKKPAAAFQYFGLRSDPFTTLALQKHNLDYFIGRQALADRLSSAIFSRGNVGVAGEPGVGKSSLMQFLQNQVPSSYYKISIGVPLDDAHYFLSELLREILVEVPKVPGLNLKEISRRVETESLSKNNLQAIIKSIIGRSKKPFLVFVDDLEKIKGDRIQHLTRSERTLQLLEELKSLLELPRLSFIISLQEEFYSKVSQVVKDGADPTVLGLFKNIVLVERFSNEEMRGLLEVRLGKSGFKGAVGDFLEPECLTLALALSAGNPRRFLYLLSEGMYQGFSRRGKRVEFQDLFEAVNEHLKLDLVCKKLLYFLAKSGRAVASNSDLQAFMGLDMISIARRLEVLSKNRLAEMVEVADGAKVYSLPGSGRPPAANVPSPAVKVATSESGERTYHLSPGAES